MPVFLRVRLTEIEKEELLKLKNARETPLRTQTRIEILIFSDRGLSVKQIAGYIPRNEATIRRTISRWLDRGKEGLFDRPRQGRPRKWKEEDLEYLQNCLELEERTYNSQLLGTVVHGGDPQDHTVPQLSQKLKEERKVELSPQRIRKILKKKRVEMEKNKNQSKKKAKSRGKID